MRKHLSRSIALLAASAALAAVRSQNAAAPLVLTPTPGERTNEFNIAPIVTKEMLAARTDRKTPSPRPPRANYQGDLNPVSIAGRNDERMRRASA